MSNPHDPGNRNTLLLILGVLACICMVAACAMSPGASARDAKLKEEITKTDKKADAVSDEMLAMLTATTELRKQLDSERASASADQAVIAGIQTKLNDMAKVNKELDDSRKALLDERNRLEKERRENKDRDVGEQGGNAFNAVNTLMSIGAALLGVGGSQIASKMQPSRAQGAVDEVWEKVAQLQSQLAEMKGRVDSGMAGFNSVAKPPTPNFSQG